MNPPTPSSLNDEFDPKHTTSLVVSVPREWQVENEWSWMVSVPDWVIIPPPNSAPPEAWRGRSEFSVPPCMMNVPLIRVIVRSLRTPQRPRNAKVMRLGPRARIITVLSVVPEMTKPAISMPSPVST